MNTVFVREGLDIKRIKEEYEYLGFKVKRDGRTLLISKQLTKKEKDAERKSDKDRSDKSSERESSSGGSVSENRDRGRGTDSRSKSRGGVSRRP